MLPCQGCCWSTGYTPPSRGHSWTSTPAPAAARCGHRQCLCTLAERSNKLAYTAQHAPHYTLHMSMSQLSASARTVASVAPCPQYPPCHLQGTVISSISMATVSGVMLDARAVNEPSRSFTVPTRVLLKAPVCCDLCVSVPISCFLQCLNACLA